MSLQDGSGNLLGPSLTLDIDCILLEFDESKRQQEEKQVTFVLLRNISALRRIYGFYSSLGHDSSRSNAFIMTKFQFWRFLKDCHLHYHDTSLSSIDRIITKTHSTEEIHNPMEKIIFREFVSYCVILAFNIYRSKEKSEEKTGITAKCLQQLLNEHILKLSGRVKGHFLMEPRRAINALAYMERSWRIYQKICTKRRQPPYEPSLCMRQFLFLLKDLKIVGPHLNTKDVLRILAVDDPCVFDGESCNLEVEMTFLEFFEALIGVALKFDLTITQPYHGSSQTRRDSPHKIEDNSEDLKTNNKEIETESKNSTKSIKASREEEFNVWCSKLHKFFVQSFFPTWNKAETLRKQVEKTKEDKDKAPTLDSENSELGMTKPKKEQTFHLVPPGRNFSLMSSSNSSSVTGSEFEFD